jgi:6-phosphogluconolactonase
MKAQHTIGITFIAALLLSACGGGGGGGGSSSSSSSSGATQTIYPRYAFASNTYDGTISAYSVDAVTGQLRQRGYAYTGANSARNLALDPTAKFLFVSAQGGQDGILAFPFDSATGRLGTPVLSSGIYCGTPLIDAAGKYLYCSEGMALRSFSIGNDGSLTELAGSPLSAPTDNWHPNSVAMSPSGKFIVAADSDNNQVLSFEINPVDGTVINGANGTLSPNSMLGSYANPTAIVVDSTSKFVYVAHNGGTVAAYSLDATTGTLTAIDADETIAGVQAAAAGNGANDLAFDQAGNYLYVANTTDQTISAFRLNKTSGALTPVSGSPFAAGVALSRLSSDPSGKFLYTTDTNEERITTFVTDPSTGALTKATRVMARQRPTTLAFSKGTTPVTDTPKAAYVTNRSSNTVSQFTIGSTGAVTPMSTASVATGANPRSIAVDPFGRFAYVAGYGDNTVSAYVIDPTTKALSPAQGTQANGGVSPTAVSTDPSGRFVFVANYGWPGSGTVSAFTINTASGTLTEVAGSPFTAGNGSNSITVDPTGRFVYVANLLNDTVTAFYIRPNTGVLMQIDADAVTAGTQALTVTNARPISIATDPTGHFLYLGTACGGNWVFSIDATTGALTRVDADAGGLCGAGGGTANLTAIDPTGRYLYTGDYTTLNAVGAYNIDTTTGALSAIAGSPYGTGTSTNGTTVDASGRYVYAAGSAGLYGFRIGSGGALTSIAAPVAAEGSPSSVATTATIE